MPRGRSDNGIATLGGSIVIALGYGGSGHILDDTWFYRQGTWMRLTSPGPSSRNIPVMASDPGRQNVLQFGGASGIGGFTRTTWLLQ